MNSDSIDTPMDQDEEEPPQNPNQSPHQDFKISNSNDSCNDNLDNLNRHQLESKQIALINLVSKEPALFNSKHEDYRNVAKKDELWIAMAKEIGWSDNFCKYKWKAIRDQYCRELKRTRSNCDAKIKWKYYKYLDFLRPFALSRNYRSKTKKDLNPGNESADQDESINITFSLNGEMNSSIKPENWSLCESSDLFNENNDIASQIIMQLSQNSESKCSIKKVHEPEKVQEPQEEHINENEDDDDDPIHTFLNIESYFEKELITLVQKTNVLYDVSHSSYRNTRVKSRVWEEISRKLKRTVRQCRSKWKALRDQYIREHKRLKHVDNIKAVSRWKHYDAMNFLEQFVKERIEYNIITAKEGLKTDTSMQEFEHEVEISLSNKNNLDIDQCSVLGDDETSELYTERLYSPTKSLEEDQPKPDVHHGAKNDHLEIEQVTEVTEAQSSSNETHDDDEVGAFFKAVAIKIRKANMSTVAFTELQIDILRVINNALKD